MIMFRPTSFAATWPLSSAWTLWRPPVGSRTWGWRVFRARVSGLGEYRGPNNYHCFFFFFFFLGGGGGGGGGGS